MLSLLAVFDSGPQIVKREAKELETDPQTAVAAYYDARAAEYDRVYDKPEQQADFARLRAWLAAFWCSHVSKPALGAFLTSFAYRLKRDAALLLIDSKGVDGYRPPPAFTDADGNAYQTRSLADGRTFTIIKNYLTRADIQRAAPSFSTGTEWWEGAYLWAAKVGIERR